MKVWIPALLAIGLQLFVPTVGHPQDAGACSISNAQVNEAWDRECAAAIQIEADPVKRAELHFRRAYSLNNRQAYVSALNDLNAACAAVPHHTAYLHERAYALNSLGRYQEALVDLNEQASLEPRAPSVYQERALTRTRLGDWAGALADRDHEAKLLPDSRGALIARAQARLWVGQFEEARQDMSLAATSTTASISSDDDGFFTRVSGLIAAWTLHSSGDDPGANCSRARTDDDFSAPTLIGDCTLAFLAGESSKDKADALTNRSIAWLAARQSQQDATNDHQAAVALDPDNPDRHTNLGFAYLQQRHSWGARQEFDRSIQIRRTYMALAGRASARYFLGEKDLAFIDAKESFEMNPNEPALSVLGDLAKDKHDDAGAKRFWMGAYHLGSRDVRLLERLKSVGVQDPAKEPNGGPDR